MEELPGRVWYLEWEQEVRPWSTKGVWVHKKKAYFKRAHMIAAMRLSGRRNFKVSYSDTRWIHVPEEQFEETLGVKL